MDSRPKRTTHPFSWIALVGAVTLLALDPLMPSSFGGWQPILITFALVSLLAFLSQRYAFRYSAKCPWCAGPSGRRLRAMPPHYCMSCGAMMVDAEGNVAPKPSEPPVSPVAAPPGALAQQVEMAAATGFAGTAFLVLSRWMDPVAERVQNAVPHEVIWLGLMGLGALAYQMWRLSAKRPAYFRLAIGASALFVFALMTLLPPRGRTHF